MKKLIISVIMFTSVTLLSSCACNSGCGSSDYSPSYPTSTSCCGASSGCCGSGGW